MIARIFPPHEYRGDACYECESARADQDFYDWLYTQAPEGHWLKWKAIAHRAWRASRGLKES